MEENKKIVVNAMPGVTELVIREGEAPAQLPILPAVKIAIAGTISSPAEFLTHRREDKIQVNPLRCHVLVSRENLSITLVMNEHDPYIRGIVEGELKAHPKFEQFGINTGKNWDPNELGQYFKMNRAFFQDKTENMKLVSDLKGFVAKVNTTIEKQKEENGSFADNYSGVVSSNLPGDVHPARVSSFKGFAAEEIEVEFYASVNGREVKLQLWSPGANQVLEEIRDKILDREIEEIKALVPEIVIIEQ